jgi:trimeric autotransporter adhesin
MGKEHVNFEVSLFLLLALLAMVLGCGGAPHAMNVNNPTNVNKPTKTLTQITITPSSPALALGTTKNLEATGVFSDGTQQDITNQVVWNSSQPSVATITSSGMAVSKQLGTTTITAADDSVTATAKLAVTQATLLSMTLTPVNPVLAKGGSQQFTVVGTFTDGSTQNLTSAVTWQVFPPGLVTLNNSGLLTAQGVGSATIKAVSGSVSAQDTISVTPATLASISLTPPNPVLAIGSTQQLTAMGSFSDGSTEDLTSSVTWTSSASGVVTVSGTGLLTAQSQGTSIIAANSGSVNATDTAVVSPPLAITVGYYGNANVSGAPDAQLRLTNDGSTGTNLWADIYVFNNDEQMEECCSCAVTPDGYLDLDVNKDLLSNPLAPEVATNSGVIEVISSSAYGATSPSPTPAGGIRGWLTQIQNGAAAGLYNITERDLKDSLLSSSQETTLGQTCSFVLSLGSGAGACSCASAGQ